MGEQRATIASTGKFFASLRSQIRILNEHRIFGNKRGGRECEDIKEDGAKLLGFFCFVPGEVEEAFKIGSGVAEWMGKRPWNRNQTDVWYKKHGGDGIMEGGASCVFGSHPPCHFLDQTVCLRLTLDYNLHNPRDPCFSYSHSHRLTLGWLKACQCVLTKQSVSLIALMCMCPRAGHVERGVWVKKRVGGSWDKRLGGSFNTHVCVCVYTHTTSNIQHLSFSFTWIPLFILVAVV